MTLEGDAVVIIGAVPAAGNARVAAVSAIQTRCNRCRGGTLKGGVEASLPIGQQACERHAGSAARGRRMRGMCDLAAADAQVAQLEVRHCTQLTHCTAMAPCPGLVAQGAEQQSQPEFEKGPDCGGCHEMELQGGGWHHHRDCS